MAIAGASAAVAEGVAVVGRLRRDEPSVDVDVAPCDKGEEGACVSGVGRVEGIGPQHAVVPRGQVVGAAADGGAVALAFGIHGAGVEGKARNASAVASADARSLIVATAAVHPGHCMLICSDADVAPVDGEMACRFTIRTSDAGGIAAAPYLQGTGVGAAELGDWIAGKKLGAVGERLLLADSPVHRCYLVCLIMDVAAWFGGVAHGVVDDEDGCLAQADSGAVVSGTVVGLEEIVASVGQGDVTAGGIGGVESVLTDIGHDVERHAVDDVDARERNVRVDSGVHLDARGTWRVLAVVGGIREGEGR